MKPNREYYNLDFEFWANIKLLNQRIGYTRRKSKMYPNGGFVIPTMQEVKEVFDKEGLRISKLIRNDKFTDFGNLVISYMSYRAELLTSKVASNLMNQASAKELLGLRLFLWKMKKVLFSFPTRRGFVERENYIIFSLHKIPR
ncbi:MAG: hypothetical protein AAF849_19020 [Bacteroidota bacterium]